MSNYYDQMTIFIQTFDAYLEQMHSAVTDFQPHGAWQVS